MTETMMSIIPDEIATDAMGEGSPEPPPRRRTAADVARRYGLLALLAVIVVFFSFLPASADTFPTRPNFNNIVGNQAVLSLTGFALLLPWIAGKLDLSVGAVMGLSSIGTAAAMSRFDLPAGAAVVVGVGIGAAFGATNGVLVAGLKLHPIISTLAVSILVSGVVQWYTAGIAINTGISRSLRDFGSETWFSVPRPAVLLVVVSIVLWYLLEHTPFGRRLYMIGDNPRAARLIGIPVDRLTFVSFTLAGALAGLAGVVLCARTGGANPQDGPGYLFPALSAVSLGATAVRPGRMNVWGTVIGVFLVAVAISGLSLAGARPWVQPVFNGAALLVAISLARVMSSRNGPAALD